MADIEFIKEKQLGVLSSTSKTSFELNIVSWSGKKAKYDIRRWADYGTKPYKGLTFSRGEMIAIHKLLKDALLREKPNQPFHFSVLYEIPVRIYLMFGEYKNSGDKKGLVTYTSWGGTPKYDIRMWTEDFKTCSKGVALDQNECEVLVHLLNKEFSSTSPSMTEIVDDDDLFI